MGRIYFLKENGWQCQECKRIFYDSSLAEQHICFTNSGASFGGFSTKPDITTDRCLQLEGELAARTYERDAARKEREEARTIARRLKAENEQLVEKLDGLEREYSQWKTWKGWHE